MSEEIVQPRRVKRSLGGRRALLGLLFGVAICLLWWHSVKHCDVLAVFGPGGKVGGVVFLQGQVWLVTSNIDMDEPWTARTLSASHEEGLALRHLLVEGNSVASPSTPVVTSHGPFFLSSFDKDAFGLPGKWCRTAGGPVWVLLPLGIWPMITWIFRRGRLWRRNRRGWCRYCGYDLQGVQADARCPECGEIADRNMAGRDEYSPRMS
jgi:hypothetical protein